MYMNDGESKIHSDILTSKEAKNYNSKRVATSLRDFVDTCDIVVGYNWKWFDGKILTTEMTLHGLAPVSYRVIDVYQLLSSHYRLSSYKLAFSTRKFGIREKIPNEGFPLWRRCAAGEQDALDEMIFYNQGDIISTADLFWTIQPYVNNSMASFAAYNDEKTMSCNCGSVEFVKQKKFWHTQNSRFDMYRCKGCGALHRGKRNLLSKEKVSNSLIRI
jgi:hypothetical protein